MRCLWCLLYGCVYGWDQWRTFCIRIHAYNKHSSTNMVFAYKCAHSNWWYGIGYPARPSIVYAIDNDSFWRMYICEKLQKTARETFNKAVIVSLAENVTDIAKHYMLRTWIYRHYMHKFGSGPCMVFRYVCIMFHFEWNCAAAKVHEHHGSMVFKIRIA